MALKPCRECARDVSTEASACPQCGAPHPVARDVEKGTCVGCGASIEVPPTSECPECGVIEPFDDHVPSPYDSDHGGSNRRLLGSSGVQVSNIVAGLASLVIPGTGQLIRGRILAAVGYFVLAAILWTLYLGWIVHIVSAWTAAKSEVPKVDQDRRTSTPIRSGTPSRRTVTVSVVTLLLGVWFLAGLMSNERDARSHGSQSRDAGPTSVSQRSGGEVADGRSYGQVLAAEMEGGFRADEELAQTFDRLIDEIAARCPGDREWVADRILQGHRSAEERSGELSILDVAIGWERGVRGREVGCEETLAILLVIMTR